MPNLRRTSLVAVIILSVALPLAAQIGSKPAKVTVTSPNGGEVWTEGTTQVVSWQTSTTVPPERIEIYLVTNSVTSPMGPKLLTTLKTNPGKWTWDNVTPIGDNFFFEISAYYGREKASDRSDKPFAIAPRQPIPIIAPPITVTSPIGGEKWNEGSTQLISWQAAGEPVPDRVDVSLVTAGGTVSTPLATFARSNPGSWKWERVGPAGDSKQVMVTLTYGKETVSDVSDAPFSIVPGQTEPVQISLTVLTPNGGEKLLTGTRYSIRWNLRTNSPVLGEASDYTVLLSPDGGKTYPVVLASGLRGPLAEWIWSVNGPPSANSRIKVMVKYGATNPQVFEDASDADFIIQQ